MADLINTTLLMSGADFFDVVDINPYAHHIQSVSREKAIAEHESIQAAAREAGIDVIKVDAPLDCQDGIFTANWALVRDDKAVLSSLPNMRQAEEPFAEAALRFLGKEIIKPPYRFSGQGDALPCGNYLFVGSHYRTDPRMHQFLADTLGYEVIGVQTIPETDEDGNAVTNNLTGWPDSFFYDLDLALGVLRPDLIAWCPEAFVPESQEKIRAVPIDRIEVSLREATTGFACNLVSTGETVIMSAHAPELQKAIEARGLRTITPLVSELGKAGGYIRCTTLTLDNA